jgi:hypothetical protein
MRLYLLTRPVDRSVSYEEYESAVVAAENEEDARNIHPAEDKNYPEYDSWKEDKWSWIEKEDIVVKEIGVANESIERGVILSSYTGS